MSYPLDDKPIQIFYNIKLNNLKNKFLNYINMNYVHWNLITRKLIRLQKKIKKEKKNRRLCRNFQRLLYKMSFIQLLIICKIFKKRLFIKSNIYFYELQTFRKIKFFQLISKEYRFYFKNYIVKILWSLAIYPLLENNNNLLTGKYGIELFQNLYKFFSKSFIQYIIITQFSNFFNKKNKYWILSNLLIEKKFLLNFFKEKKNLKIKEFENYELNILPQNSVCLNTILKYYINLNLYNFINYENKRKFLIYFNFNRIRNIFQNKFKQLNKLFINNLSINKIFFCFIKFHFKKQNLYKTFLLNQKINFYLKKQNFINKNLKTLKKKKYNSFIKYNEYVLFTLEKKKNILCIQKIFRDYTKFYKLRINFIKLYPINKGIKFLGWFFIKNNSYFYSIISYENLYSHQNEIKKHLKNSINKPIDITIYELNKKILYWQKFYNFSIESSNFWSKMNNFLFWQIWFWIKKRYCNKTAQWLYNRYWKKSTSNKWIFSVNNETLIFYK